MTENKKLIVLDPSLKNLGGHYYEYDAAIATAALRLGRCTRIYANKSCDAGLTMPCAEIHPWFSTGWDAAGGHAKAAIRLYLSKLPPVLRIPLARLAKLVWSLARKRSRITGQPEHATFSSAAEPFQKELTSALHHAECQENDIIFVPTIRTSELFALWKAVLRTPEFQLLQFHVVLRRDAAEMDLPEDGVPGITHLFKELNALPAGNAFHFYCDTNKLCEDYASLSSHRLKFLTLPIPFPRADPDAASLEKWSSGSAVKLVYLGGAREEKGFHLLSLAEHFLRKKHAGQIFWRIHAPVGNVLEEPEVIKARRHLLSVRDGNVELVDRHLSSAEFQSLLQSADIVLLPYLPEFYRARSSGILVQVLAAGKPVIVPSDTWLSSQTNGTGAVEFAGPLNFPKAVLQAVQQLAKLTHEAQGRAAAHGAFHNADALMGILERAQANHAG